jgi:hypothetical protein
MVIIVEIFWNLNPEMVDVTGVGEGLAKNFFFMAFIGKIRGFLDTDFGVLWKFCCR